MKKHVEIEYNDGVLRGYYDIGNSDTLAIITHGIGGNKLGHKYVFKQFADYCKTREISTLRVDFWGSGESDGDFADTMHSKQVDELNTVINYAVDTLKYKNIYLCSTTIGCYSVWHSNRPENIKGIINWNPITDFKLYAENSKAGANNDGSIDMNGLYTKPTYTIDLDKLELTIPDQSIPVTLVQGTLDHQYKTGDAKQKASENKWTYIEIEGGNHLWEGNQVRQRLFKETVTQIKSEKH